MNERIKELEKLATPRCYDETGCYIGNRFDVEKFAELVVKECGDLVQKYMSRFPEDHELTKQIKQHFGVE